MNPTYLYGKMPKTIYAEVGEATSLQKKRPKNKLPLCEICFRKVNKKVELPTGAIICVFCAREKGYL